MSDQKKNHPDSFGEMDHEIKKSTDNEIKEKIERANHFLNKGDFDEANSFIRQALEIDPENEEALSLFDGVLSGKYTKLDNDKDTISESNISIDDNKSKDSEVLSEVMNEEEIKDLLDLPPMDFESDKMEIPKSEKRVFSLDEDADEIIIDKEDEQGGNKSEYMRPRELNAESTLEEENSTNKNLDISKDISANELVDKDIQNNQSLKENLDIEVVIEDLQGETAPTDNDSVKNDVVNDKVLSNSKETLSENNQGSVELGEEKKDQLLQDVDFLESDVTEKVSSTKDSITEEKKPSSSKNNQEESLIFSSEDIEGILSGSSEKSSTTVDDDSDADQDSLNIKEDSFDQTSNNKEKDKSKLDVFSSEDINAILTDDSKSSEKGKTKNEIDSRSDIKKEPNQTNQSSSEDSIFSPDDINSLIEEESLESKKPALIDSNLDIPAKEWISQLPSHKKDYGDMVSGLESLDFDGIDEELKKDVSFRDNKPVDKSPLSEEIPQAIPKEESSLPDPNKNEVNSRKDLEHELDEIGDLDENQAPIIAQDDTIKDSVMSPSEKEQTKELSSEELNVVETEKVVNKKSGGFSKFKQIGVMLAASFLMVCILTGGFFLYQRFKNNKKQVAKVQTGNSVDLSQRVLEKISNGEVFIAEGLLPEATQELMGIKDEFPSTISLLNYLFQAANIVYDKASSDINDSPEGENSDDEDSSNIRKVEWYKSAAKLYEQVIEQFPRHDETEKAYLRAGKCYEQLDLFDRASDHYQELLKKYPDSQNYEDVLYRKALMELKQDKYKAARKDLVQLIKEFPESLNAKLAEIEIAKSYHHEALKYQEEYGVSKESVNTDLEGSVF